MPRDLQWLHERVEQLGSAAQRDALLRRIHSGANRTAAAGRSRAPKRTGRLARSIRAVRRRDSSTITADALLAPVEAGGVSQGSPWVLVPLPGQRVGRDERLVSIRDRRGRVLLGRVRQGRALQIVALLLRRVRRRGVDVLTTPMRRLEGDLPEQLGDDLVGVFSGG